MQLCGAMGKTSAFHPEVGSSIPVRRIFAEKDEYFMIFLVYLAPGPGEKTRESYNKFKSSTPIEWDIFAKLSLGMSYATTIIERRVVISFSFFRAS